MLYLPPYAMNRSGEKVLHYFIYGTYLGVSTGANAQLNGINAFSASLTLNSKYYHIATYLLCI